LNLIKKVEPDITQLGDPELKSYNLRQGCAVESVFYASFKSVKEALLLLVTTKMTIPLVARKSARVV